MYLYNPFKPHVIEFENGKYAIRKYNFGWTYLDNNKVKSADSGTYWWHNYTEGAHVYFTYPNSVEAFDRLNEYTELSGKKQWRVFRVLGGF